MDKSNVSDCYFKGTILPFNFYKEVNAKNQIEYYTLG